MEVKVTDAKSHRNHFGKSVSSKLENTFPVPFDMSVV